MALINKLEAIGDLVREKTGKLTRMETIFVEEVVPTVKTVESPIPFPTKTSGVYEVVEFPSAAQIQVNLKYNFTASQSVFVGEGKATTDDEFDTLANIQTFTGDWDGLVNNASIVCSGDTITIKLKNITGTASNYFYIAECVGLDADGNEMGDTTILVEKEVEVKNTMTLDEMVSELSNVDSSGPTIEELTILENGIYIAPDGVDGYSPITVEIASGGDTAIEDFLISETGDVTEYTNDRVTKLRPYVFYDLTFDTLNLPNVTELDSRCFAYTTITNLNIPKITVIPQYAFQTCSYIDTSFFNQIIEVEDNGFNGCSPNNLQGAEVEFPNLTTIGYQGFYSTNFVSIKLPKLTTLTMNISNRSQAFGYNSKIIKADFGPGLTSLPQRTFYGCSAFETLILRSETMVPLGGTIATVFYNSKIQKGTGYVYVPAALIEEYKAATYWVDIAAQFRAIEDYPDICG